ncbi:hypothetical protein SCORR_v1c08750 [Spiroplasma corruscae]|uniref:Uncharacterized protein n=1 Tax=Spiroplasma corruscae TaxID=216934 RepID=A0A222EQ49_9MOLU|nr:hypothetical protein SCORR_v1c08750 [Spiroplasma corruscae]
MKGISLDIMNQMKLNVICDLSNKVNDINTNVRHLVDLKDIYVVNLRSIKLLDLRLLFIKQW